MKTEFAEKYITLGLKIDVGRKGIVSYIPNLPPRQGSYTFLQEPTS